MKPYTRHHIILLLIGIVVALAGCQKNKSVFPIAKNGVIDLSKQLFDEEIALDGEWEFYWDKLVLPTQQNIIRPDTIVSFPFRWTGHWFRGVKMPSFGCATYQVKLLLPPHANQLKIAIPDVYSAYRLFINNNIAAENGTVANNAANFKPHWQYHAVNLPLHADSVLLTLQIANFVHSKGGISKSLFIGQQDVIDLDRERAAGIDLLLTGCLFMGGLFFLGLYLLGNRDRAILLFSLYSIVFSYRIIGTDNYVLHSILPNINWYITARLEYLTLFSGIGLFGLYTRYIYPQDANRIVILLINFCCFLFAAISLLLPPYYFTQLINPFLIVMLFCLIYIPLVYYRAYRNQRPGSVFALSSAFALMFVFGISLFHYWALLPPLQLLSFAGYIGFFFSQSLVLSHRVSFVLKQARKQAELGLIAKSDFLSTMSHEIRTPLNSVIGISHLLLKNDPRPDQAEQLNVMLFSANNLLAIVNDVLDYNKIEAGKITFEHIEMDVAAISGNIVKGLLNSAHDKGIKLEFTVDEALQTSVLGDPTRFSQVVTNLVHNAIKFTSKGSVDVIITVLKQTDATISLKIQVKDTGIGIPKDKQQLIFEQFTQADSSTSRGFGGTGLGLAITKRLLTLQNSQLQLISEEGQGAEFYFVQTFEKSRQIKKQKTTVDGNIDTSNLLNGLNILLVEDNPINVLVAQTYLKRWGANVDIAVNGLEALEKLDIKKHHVVLMDLQMPVMDGYESARQMRAKGIQLPIIALTANLPKEVETPALAAGIDDIIAKPFLPDELHRKILHAVSGKIRR